MYEYLAYYGDCMQMLDGSHTLLSTEELKKKFDQEGKNSFPLIDRFPQGENVNAFAYVRNWI